MFALAETNLVINTPKFVIPTGLIIFFLSREVEPVINQQKESLTDLMAILNLVCSMNQNDLILNAQVARLI